MAISSNATGLRPGVCTSTTRPTSPYTGQIIFETDTGYLRVWNGSAWDYLSKKQTTADTLGSTGMALITSGTFSNINSSTPLNVTGVFDSTYDNYQIVVNFVPDGATYLRCQMLIGSTPYTDSTHSQQAFYGYGTTSSYDSYYDIGLWLIGYGYSGSDRSLSTIDLSFPNVAAETSGVYNYTTRRSSVGLYLLSITGHLHKNTNDQYTGFKLYTDSGSVNASGRYYVYGYRN